jgi:methylmalonyl-CoA mutase N-terminal domain/subunit
MESLTDQVEEVALQLIAEVEARGGAAAAIEQGYQKLEIENTAYSIAQQIDAVERVVVGVNKFTIDQEEPYEPLRVNPAIEAEQISRLEKLRAERDNQKVAVLLETISATAQGNGNLLYPMKEALKAKATVGEVSDALRKVWGVYVPKDFF